MNEEIEKGLVPKLRFPEFLNSGEWECTTIGKVGTFYYGKSAPKWSLSNDAPTLCVRYGELYTKFGTIISEVLSRTNIDPSNLKFSKGGEILVPRVGEVPQDFAKNCCYLPFPNIAIGEMISVYETKEYPIFYTYYFRTMEKQFSKVVEGQNVKNLYYVNLEPIVLGKPSIQEQTKIAACLSSLDDLITAQSQKIAALKTHKKGLMQQLFPQEGETVPKLRFPEFEDEWEWKELNNLASKVNVKNKNFEVKVVLTNSASYGIVRQDSYFDREIVTQGNLTGYYVVDVDDFIYNPRISNNALVGSLKRNNLVKGVMSPLYTVFRFKQGNLSFFEHYFETIFWHGYMKNLANIGARHDRLNISNEDFFNLPLPFPTLPEQQKIADCLSSLDELINAQVKKLDAFKLHKKGLMQGLFPVVDGAN